ncbi:MAG: hypothetical protein J6M39_04330 [Lachnospiraceae bacterium]|nr:hypothetical protein [Lachnospiraceae bacterium]
MKNIEKKKYHILNNIISTIILIVFIFLENLYFSVFTKSNFKNIIDNLPKNSYLYIKNTLNKFYSNDVVDELTNSTEAEVSISNSTNESIELTDLNNTFINDNIDDSTGNNEQLIELPTSEEIIDEDNFEDTVFTKKKLKVETVSLDYFKNTLFIGDSRMVGFEIYMKIPEAMYFCYTSASVFNIFENEDDVAPIGKTKLYDLLTNHKFDKIYIMLGINNLQTNYYSHKKQYKETIDRIKKLQPQAIIYLIANLHVTDVLDPTKLHLTNENVNHVNEFIKDYADNIQTYYLDPNPMYDDENGNLKLELSTDNVHIHLVHYDKFLVYLLSNALVEDESTTSNIITPRS